MTHLLPPNLIRLFAPRPQLEFAPPTSFEKDPNRTPLPKRTEQISNRKRVRVPLSGVVSALERVRQEVADRGEVTDDVADEATTSTFSHARVTLAELAAEERRNAKLDIKRKGIEAYDPHKDPHATSDPYKTLFLGRLAYDVTEKDLHREFDMYGPIEHIRIIRDTNTQKPRGYAFIQYERERDMKAAYKDAEGIKINGRRVMVDVERGRTVKDWKPTRLGGGLGGSIRKPKMVSVPTNDPPVGPGFGGGGGRGGIRGGGGGGFRGSGGRGGFGSSRGGGGGYRGGYGNPSRSGGGYDGGSYGALPPPSNRGSYGSGYGAPPIANGPSRAYTDESYTSRSSNSTYPNGSSGQHTYDDGPPPIKRGRY